jgi:hypothetical protein
MSTAHKPPRKRTVTLSGRAMSPQPMRKPAAAAGKRGDYEVMGPRQLKKADELLTRIERRGEALSESADRLLRRVS